MKKFAGLFVLMVVAGVMIALPGSATAQEPAVVTVNAYICSVDYAGNNWEADCEPLADVEASVYLDASEYGFTDVTDGNGQAVFEVDVTAPMVVELGVPGDFADFRSYCGVVGVPEPLQVENPNSNRMIAPVGAGQDIECTFFVLPFDAQGEVSEPQTPDDVEVLPTTGSGPVEEHRGLATVGLLIGAAIMLAGLGLLAGREELFERA